MGRKADINNLIRDAEHKDKIVIDAENYLETAKANSAEAWNKVEKRRKELEQENNNALAEISKKLFWNDISAEEAAKKEVESQPDGDNNNCTDENSEQENVTS